jgi:hypothetical protein
MNIIKTKKGVSDELNRKFLLFNQEFYRIIGQGLQVAVTEARLLHRFKTRTGNLERSIMSDIKKEQDNIIGKLFLQPSIADYGKWVHNGHGSWQPDTFLLNAKNKWFAIIDQKIKEKLEE